MMKIGFAVVSLLLGIFHGEVQGAEQTSFMIGDFWPGTYPGVGCVETEEVKKVNYLLGLADTCVVDDYFFNEDNDVGSYIANSSSRTTTYYNSSDCTGKGEVYPQGWDSCFSLEERLTNASLAVKFSTTTFPDNKLIRVNYYKTQDCKGQSYQMGVRSPMTTVANECSSFYRRLHSPDEVFRTIRINNTHIQISFYRGGVQCAGEPLEINVYPINDCLLAATTYPNFQSMKIETNVPPYLSGQVNLNEADTNLNKQVAGASIGVLCGFTLLLICISMTGILG